MRVSQQDSQISALPPLRWPSKCSPQSLQFIVTPSFQNLVRPAEVVPRRRGGCHSIKDFLSCGYCRSMDRETLPAFVPERNPVVLDLIGAERSPKRHPLQVAGRQTELLGAGRVFGGLIGVAPTNHSGVTTRCHFSGSRFGQPKPPNVPLSRTYLSGSFAALPANFYRLEASRIDSFGTVR